MDVTILPKLIILRTSPATIPDGHEMREVFNASTIRIHRHTGMFRRRESSFISFGQHCTRSDQFVWSQALLLKGMSS